jgi:hypothetical protein
MTQFNERALLIRALAGIFLVQFLIVGYQTWSCQSHAEGEKDSTKVTLICNNATNTFNETGKLALTTILALLVPSSGQNASEIISTVRGSRKRKTKEDDNLDEESKV